ncbi:MAG: DUF4235 domain-containing protein [Rhodococcus sp. (in: high G+C Gram-positive bacteria)]
MITVKKSLYKPLALVVSIVGGMAAGKVFNQIYKRVGDNDLEMPDPKDLSRTNREVLVAAALHGVVYGVVKAAVDRAGAKGFRSLANEDPQ